MRIAVGSESLISRLGICALLEQAEDVQIVAEADVLGACAYSQINTVDALVLDGVFSMETARVATSMVVRLAKTAVVLVGHSPASAWMADHVNSGRALILDSSASADGMIGAICGSRDVFKSGSNGGSSRNSGTGHYEFEENGRDNERTASQLSAREWEVLSLVVQGHTDKEIARHLVISQHTVKRHVRSVLRKLRVPNRTAAATVFLGLMPAAAVGAGR